MDCLFLQKKASSVNPNQPKSVSYARFLEILASTYGPIRSLWSWTIHNLKEFSKSNMLHTAPEACFAIDFWSSMLFKYGVEHI